MSKQTIKVSFEFEIDENSELSQELEYLDSRKLISRIKEKISDYISEQYRQYPCWLDDKNIKIHFNQLKRNREDIIRSMCYTKRHDYGLDRGETSRYKTIIGVMTEEEKKVLWKEMARLFDNDIAPYMDFK